MKEQKDVRKMGGESGSNADNCITEGAKVIAVVRESVFSFHMTL